MDTDIEDLPEVTPQEEKVLGFEIRAMLASGGADALRERARELKPLLNSLAEDLKKRIAKPPAPVGGIEARFGVNERNQRQHARQVAELKQWLATGRAELRLLQVASEKATAIATSLNMTANNVREAFQRRRAEERLASAQAEEYISHGELTEKEQREIGTIGTPITEANTAVQLKEIGARTSRVWGLKPTMHGGYRLPPARR